MLKITIYRLLDEAGNVQDELATSEDPGESICLGGYGNDGKYHQFDSSEAYYASSWFANKDVGLRVVTATTEIDTSSLNFE